MIIKRIINFFKRINYRDLGIFYALIVLWLLLYVLSLLVPSLHAFNDISTYKSILKMGSFWGICSVGMTLCIASKHFDQSIGAMVAVLGCTFAVLIRTFSDTPPQTEVGIVTRPDGIEYMGISWYGVLGAIAIILALSVMCGLLNGALVAKLHIPAFIATLGTLYVFRGSAYLVSDSQPVIINQVVTVDQYKFFDFLGTGSVLGISFSFWVMVICAIIGQLILRRMKLGRDTLAIGNSVEASRISGINIDLTKILVFTLLGLFVGIAAILNTAYLASSNPGMVQGFEFRVITVVVLGGTALAGGKGSIFNSISATIFLATITVGMTLAGVPPYPQGIVQGLILIFAFSINQIRAWIEDARVKANARREARLREVT